MSAPVAPQNEEEMERALDAPPVCANLIAGGAMFVVGETGFLCSPMGMVSIEKCLQKCCCPDRMQLAFASVWKSTGASGAPDNSSRSHFSALACREDVVGPALHRP